LLRRRPREESEHGRRGHGPPSEIIEDCIDHHRIFDARNHVDRTTRVLAGQDVDLEHALLSSGPGHRDVARGCGLVGGLCLTTATFGRRHLFTQPMVRREHPLIAREVDARHRHRCCQSGHEVQWLEYHVRRAITVGRFETVSNIRIVPLPLSLMAPRALTRSEIWLAA
jgi:hypothetical protein